MTTYVCPGDVVGDADKSIAGEHTFVRGAHVIASALGVLRSVRSDDGRVTLSVDAKKEHGVVPAVGKIAYGLVTKVTRSVARIDIIAIENAVVANPFDGIIRFQDVRQTEVDKVVMYECFRPGDLVRCQVISLGDSRSYYLTTAANALGVIYAKGPLGVPMVPISWEEMQCPVSKAVEKRKVANPKA
eukprot:JZ553803.1.p1 GENE.JZ553803.1~~JZ553803.1.p1  ORF type:complete len:187 (+),score=22.48 JZ553803.1:41-601(+)